MGLNIEYARLGYGEQIIRGTNLPPEEVEDFLCLDGDVERARQWLAFAYAVREGDAEVVRGLLVYLCSHSDETADRRKRAELLEAIEQGRVRFTDLTMERLVGTHLNWSHIFALVGKEFNPTREKKRVKEIYEAMFLQDAQLQAGEDE